MFLTHSGFKHSKQQLHKTVSPIICYNKGSYVLLLLSSQNKSLCMIKMSGNATVNLKTVRWPMRP